jgi:hypothetical protein
LFRYAGDTLMILRQHLRGWAWLALVLQSTWLLAIVPLDCCAAHGAHKASAKTAQPCHEEVNATPHHGMTHGTDHGMTHETGAACPMHPGGHNQSKSSCKMAAACAGPMSALISLLALRGLVQDAPSVLLPIDSPRLVAHVSDPLTSRYIPPEAPPPRA